MAVTDKERHLQLKALGQAIGCPAVAVKRIHRYLVNNDLINRILIGDGDAIIAAHQVLAVGQPDIPEDVFAEAIIDPLIMFDAESLNWAKMEKESPLAQRVMSRLRHKYQSGELRWITPNLSNHLSQHLTKETT